MTASELIDRLLFLISVPKCVFCKTPLDYGDKALCKDCYEEYMLEKDRECSRCHRKLGRCSCSNTYLENNGIAYVSKCFRYRPKDGDSRANSLIYSLKRDYRRDTVDLLATELSMAALNSRQIMKRPEDTVVTFVPRRRSAYNKYGYDHAEILAREVARMLSLEFVSPLKSCARKAQKETTGEGRLNNAKFAVKRSFRRRLDGKRVVIVDDVATTGASLVSVARLLKSLGAKTTLGLVVSIAYKDSEKRPKRQGQGIK